MTPWSDEALALSEEALAAYSAVYRRVPPLVLEEARRRAASLRWLGSREIDGHSYELISFAEPDGALLTLYLRADDGLLDRLEHLYSDPVEGDAAAEILFHDYSEAGGAPFPNRITVRRAGFVEEELEIRLTGSDEGPPADWPQEFAGSSQGDLPARQDTVLELGEDVYLLKGWLPRTTTCWRWLSTSTCWPWRRRSAPKRRRPSWPACTRCFRRGPSATWCRRTITTTTPAASGRSSRRAQRS